MISTYATLEGAINAIPEFCKVNEQDVFVWYIKYPYSEEYQLRTRGQIFSEDSKQVIDIYPLPITHEFENEDIARRELGKWKKKISRTRFYLRCKKCSNGWWLEKEVEKCPQCKEKKDIKMTEVEDVEIGYRYRNKNNYTYISHYKIIIKQL